MKSNSKLITRISIIILINIILFSTLSHYRFGKTWVVSLLGSILLMAIVSTSNYIKKYKNKTLYFFNNTISILAIYFLLSKMLVDKDIAIMFIIIYIGSTSDLLINFFRKCQKRKLNNIKTDI